MTRVYVPRDSGAKSMGADAVAAKIAAEARRLGASVELVRNGSRGLYWLEPMVEVETPSGRMAYGPIATGDVASLFAAKFLVGGSHAKALGLTEEIDYLKRLLNRF